MTLIRDRSNNDETLELQTPRLILRALTRNDARELLELRIRNREAFRPFEPNYPDSHFTLTTQREIIEEFSNIQLRGLGLGFGIFLRTASRPLIGRIAIRNIVRGVAQNGTIGFFLDAAYHSQGYMTEACRATVTYCFSHFDLHRLDASVMPENLPSRRVFEKLGFANEGTAHAFLFINNAWRDHILYAMTVDRWDCQAP
jgi:ribosomal-protein-alanine N-acetyltransferase